MTWCSYRTQKLVIENKGLMVMRLEMLLIILNTKIYDFCFQFVEISQYNESNTRSANSSIKCADYTGLQSIMGYFFQVQHQHQANILSELMK